MEVLTNTVKSISINAVNDSDPATMVTNCLINGKPLCWSNGILFSFEPYGMTDWTAKEAAEGRIYYFSLTKSEMTEYESSLSDENNQSVPVLNLDHHAFWKEVLENV